MCRFIGAVFHRKAIATLPWMLLLDTVYKMLWRVSLTVRNKTLLENSRRVGQLVKVNFPSWEMLSKQIADGGDTL